MEEVYEYEEYQEEQPEEEQPRKKSKVWLWILVAVLALAVVAAAAFLLLPKLAGGSKSAGEDWEYTQAFIPSDKSSGYLLLPNGKTIKLRGDGIEDAQISKDFKHIAVLLDDGSLFLTDDKQSGKWNIADDASRMWIGDNSLIYRDKEERYHKAIYKNKDVVDLSKEAETISVRAKNGKLSAAYRGKNDGLYLLPDGADEATKIGSGVSRIYGLTSDGKMVVWAGSKDGKTSLYVSEGEEKVSLANVSSGSTYVYFTKDEKTAVIFNIGENRIWIKPLGKDAQSVKISGSVESISTNAGEIEKINASQLKYLYVSVWSDGEYSLYQINVKDGEKERVLSKVENLRHQNGVAAYTDEDDTLFVAKMGKKEMEEGTKVSPEAEKIRMYGEGNYVYFFRDDALYAYKVGSKAPVKVASDVEYLSVSENGQYAVIGKDKDKDGGYTLYLWKFGSKSPEKIANEASPLTVEDSGKFYYAKLDGDTVDLLYYDGKTTQKIATGLEF